MKKLLLFAIATFGMAHFEAQETQASDRQNDVMISPIELIAAPLLNISYERLLSENSGVGINGMFYFGDDDNDNYDSGFTQISPYYRMYFGKKYASGFFVEGFVPITMTKDYSYTFISGPGFSSDYYTEQKRTTVGMVWVLEENGSQRTTSFLKQAWVWQGDLEVKKTEIIMTMAIILQAKECLELVIDSRKLNRNI